jgi:mannose-binding lectin 2
MFSKEFSFYKNNQHRLTEGQARGIRGAAIPTKARLTFVQDTSLKLELRYKSENEWTTCFDTGAVALPSVSYIGWSAETGELSDNFDIISIETRNLYAITSASGSKASPDDLSKRSKKTKSGGGWGWFLVKILLFFLVLGGAYVGFTMYRTPTKKHSRFD